MSDAGAWLRGAIPDGWFSEAPEISEDREEVLIVGKLAEPELEAGASDEERRIARRARVARFREETREQRIRIALPAERRFRKKVSWGAECGDERFLFTTASVPAMTRLRMPERRVLDTLVASGVARSRSEALAWCVRLVGQNEEPWLSRLRDALRDVEQVAEEGPASGRRSA